MNETNPANSTIESNASVASERTKQVTVAGWTAGLSAMICLGALAQNPTAWPLAVGVCAIAAMVGVVCYFMLRRS